MHVAAPDAEYEGGEMRTNVSREAITGEMRGYHHALAKIEIDCRDTRINTTALLVRGTSARGNPIRKILQEVNRVRPRLIVLGSHGHGLLHNVLLGSVSSAVVRKATGPVLVVPARKRPPRGK